MTCQMSNYITAALTRVKQAADDFAQQMHLCNPLDVGQYHVLNLSTKQICDALMHHAGRTHAWIWQLAPSSVLTTSSFSILVI